MERYRDNKTNNRPDSRSYTRPVKNRSRKRRSRPVKNRSKKRRDWWNAKNLSGTGLQVLHENRESSIE